MPADEPIVPATLGFADDGTPYSATYDDIYHSVDSGPGQAHHVFLNGKTACFGGENRYEGETPANAHMHMYITDEAADYREHLLREAILAEGISEAIADRRMAVESAFRKAIIKKDISECVVRCVGQRPVKAPKPEGFPWPPVEELV